jgi:hyperosmotically inducible periplasmic protein
MNSLKKYFALSFAIIALSVVGINAQNYAVVGGQKPAGSIERKIYSEIVSLPRYGMFDFITYRVSGGTVTLGGKVITLGTKSGAERVVKTIPGVTNVVNNIEELPVGGFDDRIRRQAYATFVSRGPAQYFSTINPEVRIIVDGGRISLEGHVSRQSDANLLNILANGINGVFSVQNNLIVGRDAVR